MTTPTSGPAAAAREASRHGNGEFGVQPRAEVGIGDLVPAVGAESSDPYAGWLAVDEGDIGRVENMTRLLGAGPGEEEHQALDVLDAETLLSCQPELARLKTVDRRLRRGRSQAEKDRLKAGHLAVIDRTNRLARELVSRIWEDPRARLSEDEAAHPRMDAAWSPAAIDVVLDADGKWTDRDGWKDALELEHVVPASTLAKLVAQLHEQKATPERVAEVLRECVHHVVVRKAKRGDQIRYQPKSSRMHRDVEQVLITHYTDPASRLDQAEIFKVTWSRYLDPLRRGRGDREMDWEISDLRTVTDALSGDRV